MKILGKPQAFVFTVQIVGEIEASDEAVVRRFCLSGVSMNMAMADKVKHIEALITPVSAILKVEPGSTIKPV